MVRSVSSARVGGEDRRAELLERASERFNVYQRTVHKTDRDLKPATTTQRQRTCASSLQLAYWCHGLSVVSVASNCITCGCMSHCTRASLACVPGAAITAVLQQLELHAHAYLHLVCPVLHAGRDAGSPSLRVYAWYVSHNAHFTPCCPEHFSCNALLPR
ncbi:uncharacterized protein CC84DRAFT_988426 [Paraphaeosphaeria sporulosa]|uniref:Uncharacterized protein n=1 Tax=Paraphaeosphaeria sporulosa TaxID=1460663 RepID=A0A177C5E7_9PLEO|nr:uncharacterized protein CC84DRAFT_988426 [Paraphaeosphaeria sporulosa]OAG02112.1 hypothetical protein CC84DRAFT_988426 [Paraphaeosphaeria sporulosa]